MATASAISTLTRQGIVLEGGWSHSMKKVRTLDTAAQKNGVKQRRKSTPTCIHMRSEQRILSVSVSGRHVSVSDDVTASSGQSEDETTVWSELTARKKSVQFRSRKKAKRTPSGDWAGNAVPSSVVQRALASQALIADNTDLALHQRLIPIFYCWYLGWILDVYATFSSSGRQRSFYWWTLSNVLVSGATLLTLVLTVTLSIILLSSLLTLLHAALYFISFLLSVCIIAVAMATVFTYNS